MAKVVTDISLLSLIAGVKCEALDKPSWVKRAILYLLEKEKEKQLK